MSKASVVLSVRLEVTSAKVMPPSRTLISAAERVTPFRTKVEELFPVKVRVSKAEPILMVSATELLVPRLMTLPALPVARLIVLALLPEPKLTVPVVPESKVRTPVVPEVMFKLVVAAELKLPVPAKLSAVALTEMVLRVDTPVKAPAVETLRPVEASEKVSFVSPIVIVSASVLVPIVTVSQAAELQSETEVAFVLPRVKAPALVRSRSLAKTEPVVVMLSAPVSIEPKPEVMEPEFKAPVPVMAVVTASFVSTRAPSLVSKRLSSAAEIKVPALSIMFVKPPPALMILMAAPTESSASELSMTKEASKPSVEARLSK